MTISNQRLREEYEGAVGPAKVKVTFVRDTTTNTHRLELGGVITIDPNGIKNTDLTAAQDAFQELVVMIRDKYPYVAP